MPETSRCECGSGRQWRDCCGVTKIDNRRRARMDQIDRLPADIRELVHEYGYNAVRALMDCGVTKPARIKHCIEMVLNEFSPTRGSYSSQGLSKDVNTGIPR